MTKKAHIQQGRLEGLESDFRSLLHDVLAQCAAGRWGLFGQNDHPDGTKFPYLHWAEAEQLKRIAHEIQSIRQNFGESDQQVGRFLYYCSLRGPNISGEPKLAQELLDEMQSGVPKR